MSGVRNGLRSIQPPGLATPNTAHTSQPPIPPTSPESLPSSLPTPPNSAAAHHGARPRPDHVNYPTYPALTNPLAEEGLVELHESLASLLAARGQWRQAYYHLRSALDLMSSRDTPQVPEQSLRQEVARLRKEHAKAREQSLRDSLTSSYNRRFLDERLTELLGKAADSPDYPGVGVAMVDIDWFKHVNDTYGHVLGDRVLQSVVDVLKESLPSNAFCARYGGEEFVLVLPAADSATAVSICENARGRVERFPWTQLAPGLHVTVSIGVVVVGETQARTMPPAPNQRFSTNAEDQLFNADVLLYAAKQSGRNAVAYRAGNDVRFAGIRHG